VLVILLLWAKNFAAIKCGLKRREKRTQKWMRLDKWAC
jgi:hypothetical protein